MQVSKLSLQPKCRKSLRNTLLLLAAVLAIQIRFSGDAKSAAVEAQQRHWQQLVLEAESLRQRNIAAGFLWEGELHEDFTPSADYSVENTSHGFGVQKRLMVQEVPLDEKRDYLATIELHECVPGKKSCTSGGSLRVTRSDGSDVFICQVGLLQTNQVFPSFYALTWAAAEKMKSEEEKRQLLDSMCGKGPRPSALTFTDDLTQAYALEAMHEASRRALARKLSKDIIRAILADRADSAA